MDRFQISAIELLALRKLELVSKALATKLTGDASREQECLARTLGDVLDRYQIHAARPATPAAGDTGRR